MTKYRTTQIGWIVMAQIEKGGRRVDVPISRNYGSLSSAEHYATVARRDPKYLKVWTKENFS